MFTHQSIALFKASVLKKKRKNSISRPIDAVQSRQTNSSIEEEKWSQRVSCLPRASQRAKESFQSRPIGFFFFQIEIVRVRERENGRRYIEQFRANYFLYMCTNKNVVYKHNRRDMILLKDGLYIYIIYSPIERDKARACPEILHRQIGFRPGEPVETPPTIN